MPGKRRAGQLCWRTCVSLQQLVDPCVLLLFCMASVPEPVHFQLAEVCPSSAEQNCLEDQSGVVGAEVLADVAD